MLYYDLTPAHSNKRHGQINPYFHSLPTFSPLDDPLFRPPTSSSITMEAPKPAMTTSTQPQAVQMNVMSPPSRNSTQQCERQKASRLRGGGAGRDCFLGLVECFLCFECCKDCCECFADIICCPCEMCC